MKIMITILKAAIFITLFLAITILITGCQTAGATLDAAGDIRGKVAEKELETHIRGVCSGNFDKVRERFGKNDQDWNSILTMCESGQNATDRNPGK